MFVNEYYSAVPASSLLVESVNNGSWTRVPTTAATNRKGLIICCDPLGSTPTRKLYVALVGATEDAPTALNKDPHFVLASQASISLPVGNGIKVYVQASATSVAYTYAEVQ